MSHNKGRKKTRPPPPPPRISHQITHTVRSMLASLAGQLLPAAARGLLASRCGTMERALSGLSASTSAAAAAAAADGSGSGSGSSSAAASAAYAAAVRAHDLLVRQKQHNLPLGGGPLPFPLPEHEIEDGALFHSLSAFFSLWDGMKNEEVGSSPQRCFDTHTHTLTRPGPVPSPPT